ncbi:MAG: hypothetical protein IPH96_12445 [Saprospiraceae bacterium]|nr:hypothetical protein [Saprospiraceae bacterium]
MRKVFLFLFLMSLVIICDAQCPMCKMAAESNMKDGGMAGRGLNQGSFICFATIPGHVYYWLYILERKEKT